MDKITLSVQEAAKIIGIGTSKMYQMVKSNQVPNIKLGGRFVIPKEKFISWVNSVSVGG